MAAPPFCNGCFQRPRGAAPELRLTSCGHLLCPRCLPSGQKELCVICRIPCRTIMLSKKMNSDIQSLFMRIDELCRKYSREVSQISQFQEKHRGHLLTYYRGKIAKLEGYWKAAQQMQYIQHQQHLKPRQEGNQVPSSISVKTSVSKKQNDNAAYFLCSTPLSTSEIRDPSMELDCVSPSVRKVETVAGPARLSVISPPQNGQMGSVSCRSSCFSGMALCQNSTSERSTPLRMPRRETPYMSQIGSSQNNKISVSDAFGLRTPQHFRCTSASSLPVVTRCPHQPC
ncbi:probable E3 SUMO-protein ligase RNF212 isoform X3 [Eublepharis macularius]|uniref:Probable E3 SUMO-protein ligase RNF212 isoform X3 n=1 Tax=Eublepharis macularius TaxID=481883 RepID=A0AA97J463_EUBMA|nr:probable E3 SUMO-protein ligase RNF212 isoform X3 [Eublepharis macularius]